MQPPQEEHEEQSHGGVAPEQASEPAVQEVALAPRRRRRWGRGSKEGKTESFPYVAQAVLPASGAGRFRPGALTPVKEIPRGRNGAATRSRSLRTFDRVLLVVEVLSALVVAWIVAQYIYTVYFDTTPHRVNPPRTLPQQGNVQPVGTPTVTPRPSPTRVAEVAPPEVGGPDSGIGGPGGQPPASPTPTATPTIEPSLLLPSRLRIPVMFLDSPVHEVTVNMGKWEVAPMDIGHHAGTADPGEVGNVVLAGHRDINSALFRDLDRLQPGDELFVSNSMHEYRYVVNDSFVVSPEHSEVMLPTDDRRVTLITCTPVGLDTQRLIVTATLDEHYLR